MGRGLIAAVLVVVLCGYPPSGNGGWARAQDVDGRPPDDRRPWTDSERLGDYYIRDERQRFFGR